MERCFERRVWTAAIEHRRSSVKANLVLSGGCLSHGSGDEKRRARNLKLRRNVSLNSLRLQFILIQIVCYCCVLLIFFSFVNGLPESPFYILHSRVIHPVTIIHDLILPFLSPSVRPKPKQIHSYHSHLTLIIIINSLTWHFLSLILANFDFDFFLFFSTPHSSRLFVWRAPLISMSSTFTAENFHVCGFSQKSNATLF